MNMRRLTTRLVLAAGVSAALAAGAAPLHAEAANAGAVYPAAANGTEAPLPPDPVELAREGTAAWIVPWDRANVMASLRAHADAIGRISPFWYVLRSDGMATQRRTGAMDAEVLALAAAHGMVVLPTIGNEFDARRLSKMLASPTTRRRHVGQLMAIAQRPQFGGIDLDYENIAPRDRVRFAKFVHELAAELHERNLQLSVTVMASTRAGGSRYDLGTDYRAIGEDADEVRVMAYDYNWACGSAGPVAPIDWVERVVVYVSGKVPTDKLVLGVPLYGYDWPRRGCAKARTWRETQALTRRRSDDIVAWAARWQTRQLRYGRGRAARVVWYEDAASTAAKARLATRYGLRGVALWRTGGEDPGTWPALAEALGALSEN